MNQLEFAYFGLCTLLVVAGGIATVAAPNPIRGAMGLLASILGIAGLYLMLAAEFLAVVQVMVYAGAVVVLFLFVIMLLGPSATSPRDARSAIPRYFGAGVFLLSSAAAVAIVLRGGIRPATEGGLTKMPAAPSGFGTVEAIGHEMFGRSLVAFELSGALLLIAVIGAVSLARGRAPRLASESNSEGGVPTPSPPSDSGGSTVKKAEESKERHA